MYICIRISLRNLIIDLSLKFWKYVCSVEELTACKLRTSFISEYSKYCTSINMVLSVTDLENPEIFWDTAGIISQLTKWNISEWKQKCRQYGQMSVADSLIIISHRIL